MHQPPSNTPRFIVARLSSATALACGMLLTACGGGGGSSASPTGTSSSLSEADATADASNAQQTGDDSASALDTVYDTTAAVAVSAASASAAPGRAQALSLAAPVGVVVDCAGGGTATLTISGGTLAGELNGTFDAGEHYSVTYAQCSGATGRARLNGSVEMDIDSVSDASTPVTAATVAMTDLTVSIPLGTVSLNGSASVSRSEVVAGSSTTTTSNVTASSLALSTSLNGRDATFSLTDLDATRIVESTAGVVSGSQYSGHHALSGDANGRSFSTTVSTSGSIACDASGAPVSGTWTVVRPMATTTTSIASGTVTLTVDDGNDGTIDHTWTFPTATLTASAG